MSSRRLIFILSLIALFMVGVFVTSHFKIFQPSIGANQSSDSVRGIVSQLLPSGKVIVVKKEDGNDVLVSLTDASLITNELGEDLFYSDVKAGMPISAAGIHGVKDDVLLPSLITVQLSHASQGTWLASSLTRSYFVFSYNETRWKPSAKAQELEYQPVLGCVISADPAPVRDSSWVLSSNERKIGGNIVQDARYTSSQGEPKLRVVTLEDAGEKYGAKGEAALGGSYEFWVRYPAGISLPDLVECTRAADQVLETFHLRSASKNILLIDPSSPIRVNAGEEFIFRGMAHSPDRTLRVTIVDESGKKIVAETTSVTADSVLGFGAFRAPITVPRYAESRLHLRIFQYSLRDGKPTDIVDLPLSVQ